MVKKPSNLSFEEAASVPVASQTAWEGLFTHGHLEKGQTVLIATAWGADNSLGTWKANTTKCKYTPAPWPVKSLTVTREAAPGGVKVTNTGMRIDGSAINASYTAKYDGSSSEVTGEGPPKGGCFFSLLTQM